MIKELLNRLQPFERRQLMYAFDQEIAQYIELDGGIFVGVHVEPLKHLVIEEQAGVWACGKVKHGS